uniref:Ionotropic glutamate receptor C-terminal domain-containing protein n=1 Tax=Musca domestica TaxID=7370 RepID=A0A1I8M9D1_MUSDO
MQQRQIEISLLTVLFIHVLAVSLEVENLEIFDLKTFLQQIYAEKEFETLLVISDRESLKDNRVWWEVVQEIPLPKVLVTYGAAYEFVRSFNSEIFVIFVFHGELKEQLMATGAEVLNFMRQTRILVLVEEGDRGFQLELLKLCELYKMTNVLLKGVAAKNETIQQLKPYPRYQWSQWRGPPYYPQHWRNLENKTVIYFTDTTMTLSFPYEDGQGGVRLNGYIARLVLLFGEVFHGHMQMYASHEVAARTSLTQVNQMAEDNLIDIPMTLSHYNDGKWLYKSAVYDFLEGLVMIPTAQALSTTEVYGVLLNRYFFGCVLICTLLFALFQSLVDYCLDHSFQAVDLVLNYRFFSGILGQSFTPKESPWRSLKLLYFLVFVAGLNISTQFSATMNTLITSPPNHAQIQSFEDLKHSSLKILAITSDIEAIEDAADAIRDSLLLTDSIAFYEENRNNFNTSMGYFLVSLSWKVLRRKQQYFSHNIFNVYPKMTLFRMPCALQLQKHSQYKEPLDHLINRVHEVGLPAYWYANTFGDMLRTKRVTISSPPVSAEARAFEVKDLFWAWIIVVGGEVLGSVVFFAELLFYRLHKKTSIDLK